MPSARERGEARGIEHLVQGFNKISLHGVVSHQLLKGIVARDVLVHQALGIVELLLRERHADTRYAGAHRLVDTGGQLAKFNKRFKDFGLEG